MIYHAENNRLNRVTLPTVPGVTVTTDRSDTAPRQPIIRRPMGPVKGAALRAMHKRDMDAVVQMFREVMEGGE